MTIRQITAANADIKIKRLYETAFPDGEQIPWDDLMRLVGKMPLDFTAYYDDEEFIGFTIVYPRKAFNWYWYFAVCEELRGKGYGTRATLLGMQEARDHFGMETIAGDTMSLNLSMRSVFEKLGFALIERVPHAFDTPSGPADRLVYQKDLSSFSLSE